MDRFAADYLANLTADLTSKLLTALGQNLRESMIGSEEYQSLRHCIETGVGVLLEKVSNDGPETIELLQDIFTAFFADPSVIAQLRELLYGNPLDHKRLNELFEQAGYDTKTLPELKFEDALIEFEDAFMVAAINEPPLQELIKTGHEVTQTRIQRQLLEKMQEGTSSNVSGNGNVLGNNSQSTVYFSFR
jgi:hypothetical protein